MWLYLLLGAVAVVIYVWLTLRPANFPPGPPCLPIIGSVPFIKMKGIHFYMEEARAKYGPVIGLKLATNNTVFICGPKQVMEVFKMEVFQGRPHQLAIASNNAKKGIILTDGPFWQTQRRFTLRHLRDFGFGKTSIEGAIMEEVKDFFEQSLYKTNRIQVAGLFNTSAINVLWRMISGKRYQHDDEEFKVLLNALHETFKQGGFNNNSVVFLRRFLRMMVGFPEKIECEETLIKFIKDSIEEHKKTRTEEPRDFLDVYLREIEKSEDPDFNELTLISICLDLFTAGAESVGNTLTFCIMYLILYPDIQQTVWEEINDVLGDKDPELADRSRLPKIEAFLSEVARFNTIAPIPVPRRALNDVMYEGYNIPKNTFVILSLWAVFRDKDHWGDPDVFRPSRFLDNGKYKKDEWLVNFGIGKRQCPGESLAKNVMFLFLVKLIQEFEFSVPEGCPKPNERGIAGFTVSARPFEAAVKIRGKTTSLAI